ncbi:MAG: mannitol dehydrogenase family protein, partial [Spirochaetaceae bacterium]|nr:mannitol dehydrogenase family protein [Spirochaetaceae bacterium]
MLTINRKSIRGQKAEFEKAGVCVGNIDIDAIVQNTARAPLWAHYGAGNLFKAHHAMLAQRLIEDGFMTSGIVALVPNDFANIETLYTRNDNLFARVVMKKDGTLDTRIISAVTAFLPANPADSAAWGKAHAVFANPSLQMLTITITEKGYNLKTLDGAYTKDVRAEFDAGPRGNDLAHAM